MIIIDLKPHTYQPTAATALYRVKNLSRKAPHLHNPQFLDENMQEERQAGII